MAVQPPPPYSPTPPPGWEPPPPPKPLPTGTAVAALCFGIFGLIAVLMSGWLGLLFGITAATFGIIALSRVSKGTGAGRGMAVWGLILGILFTLSGLGRVVPSTPQPAAAASSAVSSSGNNAYTAPALPPHTAPAAPVAATAPQVVNPKTIALAVDGNKARAAQQWDGKFVQFTAEVTDISTAFSPSVQFGKVTGQSFSMIQFVCYPADESALIPYTKGQSATVRGTVEVGYAGVIKLNNCEKVR
jgi:hypothetical protein